MLTVSEYKTDLAKMLEVLPEDKIIEVIDFARFLANQYSKETGSLIDKDSLLSQQRALNHIWDNDEEDLYEL